MAVTEKEFVREKTHKLTKIMLLYVAVFFCVPMIGFSCFSYAVFQKNIETRVLDYSLLLTRQIGTNLDLKIGEYKDLLIQIITNNEIITEVKSLRKMDAEVAENPHLSTQIVQYVSVAPEFKSMAFLSGNQYIKTIYVWNDMSFRKQVYGITMKEKNQFQWFGKRIQTYRDSFGEHSESVFSMSKEVLDFTNGENMDTVLVIDIQCSSLEDICNKIVAKDLPLSWCIVDGQGKLQFSSENFLEISNINEVLDYNAYREKENYYADGSFNGCDYLVSSSKLEVNNWRIVTLLDAKYVRENVMESLRPLLGTWMIIIMAMAAGICIMIKSVVSPINRLAGAMKVPVEEHLIYNPQEAKSGIEEIAILYSSYNTMMQEIERLVSEVYEKGEQKRIVQIKALESQINPHFLYNTLDTIKWTALVNKGEYAAEMVSMLSKLLHISLSGGSEMIPLKNEVEHVRAYVGIQQYRMDIEFHVVYMIEKETECLLVPKILFQPFVENSMIHGFTKGMKGMVEVLSFLSEDSLILQVNDNGLGFEEEEIIQFRKEREKGKRFSSIGIHNVRERIHLICGPEYGVKIRSKVGYGTNVEIRLPVLKQEEEEC